MDLPSTVTAVLRNKPVGQISFSLDGITVDQSQMDVKNQTLSNDRHEIIAYIADAMYLMAE